MSAQSEASASSELHCGSCGRLLDATDKFCRECGLPTVRRAELQQAVPPTPPDVAELKRAMEVAPDLQPFVRPGADMPAPEASMELTTGSVLKVTSPTLATQMASSTLLMVGLIVLLLGLGVLLLVLAFQG